jgi:hypothetical protein
MEIKGTFVSTSKLILIIKLIFAMALWTEKWTFNID